MQWLKFTMVTTEMISSADNTARGFISVKKNSLDAGQDVIGSKVFKITKNQSVSILGGDSPATLSESVVSKVWEQVTAAEERTNLLIEPFEAGAGDC